MSAIGSPRSADALPSVVRERAHRVLRALMGLAAGAGVLYVGVALWVGWEDLLTALLRVGGWVLVFGPVVSVVSFLPRFARWQLLLARTGSYVPAIASLRVYIAGLALTATPGKAGETLRSVLLLRWGVPVGASLAAFVADRLSDLVAVIVLAASTSDRPLVWSAGAGLGIAAGFVASWIGVRLQQSGVPAFASGPRWVRPLSRVLLIGCTAFRSMWQLPWLVPMIAAGLAAYGAQGFILAACVHALWPEGSITHSMHVFAVSALTGAASMLPGGIGATEATMIAMLTHDGMPVVDAVAAAVAARLATLWLAIALGSLSLLYLSGAATREVRRA